MVDGDSRVGRVVNVSGSRVVILIEESETVATGGPNAVPQMGELVKMFTPGYVVFGMVTGLSIPLPSTDQSARELKVVELELQGEADIDTDGPFRRGVSAYPILGEGVYSTSRDDLQLVYGHHSESTVRIGTIHQDQSLPVHLAIDGLLGKHVAILGTTGSGKSCAVSLMLHAILKDYPFGHVVLLDPHNEYGHSFGEMAEQLSPANLRLPYWLFNFEEIVEVVLGHGHEAKAAEVAILNETITAAKRQYLGGGDDAKLATADAPIPYQMSDLIQLIDEAMGRLDNPEKNTPYMRVKYQLESVRRDARFSFMFGSNAIRDNLKTIVSRIFRIPVAGKPITIIDLSAVPSEILNVVVSVLCRLTFDFALWSNCMVPITLVCEEAHRYAPQDTSRGFEPAKRALSRIAKEGRKYGVSLCVVSQRPSELAAEIISQCNTIFALRLSNQNDQEFVRAILSDSARGLLEFLPSLRNAEAIAVGEGVSIPVRLCFDRLPEQVQPRSGTAEFSSAWSEEWDDDAYLDQVIDAWQRQKRRPGGDKAA